MQKCKPMIRRWKKVRERLSTAKGICWDGCHKIYVLMDDATVQQQRDWNYEVQLLADIGIDEAYEILRNQFAESCELRFITAVSSVPDGSDPNDGYEDLIPQFA